jgi:hypothetical protein
MLISDADYSGAVDKSVGRFSVHGLIHGSSLIHIIHGLLTNRKDDFKTRPILYPMKR